MRVAVTTTVSNSVAISANVFEMLSAADTNVTEKQIMNEIGYLVVWDCGNYKYEMVIKNYLPIIQIELADECHVKIVDFLTTFGYSEYHMDNGKLSLTGEGEKPAGDLFFLTGRHLEIHSNIIINKE